LVQSEVIFEIRLSLVGMRCAVEFASSGGRFVARSDFSEKTQSLIIFQPDDFRLDREKLGSCGCWLEPRFDG
jgi:hypothetical protein